MNKTVKIILKGVSYIIALLLGAEGAQAMMM